MQHSAPGGAFPRLSDQGGPGPAAAYMGESQQHGGMQHQQGGRAAADAAGPPFDLPLDPNAEQHEYKVHLETGMLNYMPDTGALRATHRENKFREDGSKRKIFVAPEVRPARGSLSYAALSAAGLAW